MKGTTTSRWRFALALLLLCCVSFGQIAVLSSSHAQHRMQGHECPVCFAGSLPFLSSPGGDAASAPVLLVQWLEFLPNLEVLYDSGPAASSSRAPPAYFS
jgi:hypothetical protein